MQSFRIKVQSIWRKEEGRSDDALGSSLVSVCRRAIASQGAPPAAVVVRPSRIDLFTLHQLKEQQIAVGTFLAGLASSSLPDQMPDVEAVGLMGTFMRRRGREPGAPVALLFLEWTDCRWWSWQALLEADQKTLLTNTETILLAEEGDAKPLKLGGWWSLARRKNMAVRLDPEVH